MTAKEFSQLRAFAAVARHHNFARAAQELGITASTLSQTIRQLEERVGLCLIHRTTRSMSLTEAGDTLVERFAPALDEMQAAVADAQHLRDSPTGTVRLQVPRPASTLIIEPLLARFFGAYPDIVVDLTIEDAATDIVGAGFDVGVRLGELLEGDMVAIRLCDDMRALAVASPGYLERHGTPETPADLLSHRCINWRWPGTTGVYHWEFAEHGRWFSIAVSGPLIVSHRDAAVRAAVDGIGIAFMSEPWLGDEIASGRLKPLLERYSPQFPAFYMFYPSRRRVSAAVRAFVDFYRKHVPIA